MKTRKQKHRQAQGLPTKVVLQRMSAQLAAAKRAHAALLVEQNQGVYKQQVLVDTILQLEEVISFKERVHRQTAALPQDASAPVSSSGGSCGRYVTQLLQQVSAQQVQEVFALDAAGWLRVMKQSALEIPMLLDMVGREDAGSSPGSPHSPLSYVTLAQQQLHEAVDRYVRNGALGFVFADVVGRNLGACTAANMMTMQLEAPPEQHWRQVAQRLQLTHTQLLQLAAGYHTFVQLRRVQHQVQLAVANLVSCPNTCSVQLLAAAKEAQLTALGDSSVWEVGQPSAGAACCFPDPSPGGREGLAAESSGRGASSDQKSAAGRKGRRKKAQLAASAGASSAAHPVAAAEQEELEGAQLDPLLLVDQLMRMLNRSALAINLLLHNTLTRRQIARMIVACYPFVPRAAPLIEAAMSLMPADAWLQQPDQQAGDAVSTATAAAAAASKDERLSEQHSLMRASLMRQQCAQWWQE